MILYTSWFMTFVVTSFAFLTPLLKFITSVHPSYLTFLGLVLALLCNLRLGISRGQFL